MAVDMKEEQLNSKDLRWMEMDTQFSPDEDSKLLENNHKEMDKSIQQMRRLIEEEGEGLQNNSEFNLHFISFCNNYQLLAEHCEKLVGKLQQIDSCPDQATQQITPDSKLGLHKSGNQTASPSTSSGRGSSDLSVKEGTDSSSQTSNSDSESSSFSSINIFVKPPVDTDNDETHKKHELELAQEQETDCASKVRGKRAYEALEERLLKCEEELTLCKLKLQLSEEEAARLKSDLENRDVQLQKGQVSSELQQAQIADSIFKIARLNEELNASKDRVKDSDEEIAVLKHEIQQNVLTLNQAQEELEMVRAELDKEKMQVQNLQDRITSYRNDLSDRDEEIEKLKNELSALQKEFSEQTAKLKSDNVGLTNKQIELEARLTEWDLRGKQLEDELRQCEVEKTDMRDAQKALETGMRVQINQLKQGFSERCDQIEALNKEHDKHKLTYGILLAERDVTAAKVNNLLAEVHSRDTQIARMEDRLRQWIGRNLKLASESEGAQKVGQELRSRVLELETEVEGQRAMLMDRAEEKREAIRQLCFSLEHYRSGYKELYQAVFKNKQQCCCGFMTHQWVCLPMVL